MKKLLIVLIVMTSLTARLYSQKPAVVVSDKAGWHKIGETTANFKTEKDELVVLGADKFKAIKIKVTDAPIHIDDMVVYYESGNAEEIPVRSDFKAGGESKVFNLKDSSRELKKVSFVYKTVANSQNDKAHVELYGLK